MFKVMIVDDMKIMRKQIKRLALWGESSGFYIIDEAEDGQEALEKLKTQPVDLLITDIKMPRINGIELLKEVNAKGLASCVIFLSEHSEFSFAREAIKYGIFDYLVKPVDPEELGRLLEKVRKHIEDKKETRAQMKSLENKLIEKVDVYYPDNQVNSVMKYVIEGNNKALAAASAMMDETAAALEKDIMKTAIVLQKAYSEIWTYIIKSYDWIEKFIDTESYSSIVLTQCSDLEEIKGKMNRGVEKIIDLINSFILNSSKSPLIKEICLYVIRNIENEISLGKISEALFITKNYIGDVFKQETGITAGEYITRVKMERAKRLIAEGNLKSYEIAQKLDYSDSEYFGRLFKKHTGLTTMEFKNKIIK